MVCSPSRSHLCSVSGLSAFAINVFVGGWNNWLIFAIVVLSIAVNAGSLCADDVSELKSIESPAGIRGVNHLVLITDDDFLNEGSNAWCARPIEKALKMVRDKRPANEIRVRNIFAGSPLILNKDRPKTGPRRLICFICDSSDRVLAMCVGVPTGNQLLTLIEDADELAILASLGNSQTLEAPETESHDPLVKAHHERIASYVLRHYRPLVGLIDEKLTVAVAAEKLQQALQNDLAERFFLSPPLDYQRLVSVQQHAEAYRHWCSTLLSCLLMKQVDDVWQDVATVIWGSVPWYVGEDPQSLIAWHDASIPYGPVILDVRSEVQYLDLQLKAAQTTSEGRQKLASLRQDRSEQGVEDAMKGFESRYVHLAEVAFLLSHRGEKAIDGLITKDASLRWLLLESKDVGARFFSFDMRSRLMSALDRIDKVAMP